MVNPFYIALPALGVCLLIAYLIRERSLRNLDITQAGTLVLALRPIRIRFMIAMATLVAVFLVLRYTFPRLMLALFVSVLALAMTTIVIAQIAGRRALIQARLPAPFRRLYGVAQVFELLAYGWLVSGMMATLWFRPHA